MSYSAPRALPMGALEYGMKQQVLVSCSILLVDFIVELWNWIYVVYCYHTNFHWAKMLRVETILKDVTVQYNALGKAE